MLLPVLVTIFAPQSIHNHFELIGKEQITTFDLCPSFWKDRSGMEWFQWLLVKKQTPKHDSCGVTKWQLLSSEGHQI